VKLTAIVVLLAGVPVLALGAEPPTSRTPT
jgi:hypothetical protein